MSSTDTAIVRARPAIGFFERYLTVWVSLCIMGGILAGQLLPQLFQAIGRMEVAQVNLPVGVLIWVMIIQMLVKIDFAAMTQVKRQLCSRLKEKNIPNGRCRRSRQLRSFG